MNRHHVLEETCTDSAREATDLVFIQDLADFRVRFDHFLYRPVSHIIMKLHALCSFKEFASTIHEKTGAQNDLDQFINKGGNSRGEWLAGNWSLGCVFLSWQ